MASGTSLASSLPLILLVPRLQLQWLFFRSSYSQSSLTSRPFRVYFLFLKYSSPFLILVSFTNYSFCVCVGNISQNDPFIDLKAFSLCYQGCFLLMENRWNPKYPLSISLEQVIPTSGIPFPGRENIILAECLVQRHYCMFLFCFVLFRD